MRLSLLGTLSLLFISQPIRASGQTTFVSGVIVEEVEKGWAGAEAGLLPGDLVISWASSDSTSHDMRRSGAFNSPFDFLTTALELQHRAEVVLQVQRRDRELRLNLARADWRVTVGPRLPADASQAFQVAFERLSELSNEAFIESLPKDPELLLDTRAWLLLAEAKQLARKNRLEEGARLVRLALRETEKHATPWVATLISFEWAEACRPTDLVRAEENYQKALKSLNKGQPSVRMKILLTFRLGTVAYLRGRLPEAENLLGEAIRLEAEMGPESLELGRMFRNLGNVFLKKGKLDEAVSLYDQALMITERQALKALDKAGIVRNLALIDYTRGDLEAAEKRYREVYEIQKERQSDGVALAESLSDLGNVAFKRGDYESCMRYYVEALAKVEAAAPGSLAHASALERLGILANRRDDLRAALALLERALELYREQAPSASQTARTAGFVGVILDRLGLLSEAEQRYEEARLILRDSVRDSNEYAGVLHNMAIVSKKRGRVGRAEELILESLAVLDRAGIGGDHRLLRLNMLGEIATTRGDHESAEKWFQEALKIAETTKPLDVAASLGGLGRIAYQRGDFQMAERLYQQAHDILRRHHPGGIFEAFSLVNLGWCRYQAKDYSGARDLMARALEIHRRHTDGSLSVATALYGLAFVNEKEGHIDQAVELYREAASIRGRLSPYSAESANGFAALGRALRANGKPLEAIDAFELGVRSLEGQFETFGGTQESQVGLVSRFEDLFKEAIELLIEQNSVESAFEMLERSRVRILLQMIHSRDVTLSGERIDSLERERRLNQAEYHRTLKELGTAREAAVVDEKRQRLNYLQAMQQDIAANMAAANLPAAQLHFPKPLTLSEASQVLPDDTVLLSFSVHEGFTAIFVVTTEGLQGVHRIPLGAKELTASVDRFRRLISAVRYNSVTLGVDAKELARQSERLFMALVQPARSVIESKRAILIAADGPLTFLPFAALTVEEPAGDRLAGSTRYLVQWRPVHFVQSATLYGQIRSAPANPNSNGHLVAFGATGSEDEYLPWSELEVSKIADLFSGASSVFVGADATEKRAKSLDNPMGYVHYAVHVDFNPRAPLESALLLWRGPENGEEDGRLEAWEVFEQVRLNADLVVLSGCESGLGKPASGEGLIGLTRAFQFAGARSVLASLWRVSDKSAAEFMARMYGQLKARLPKDEAVRQAQIELIENQSLKLDLPYYWAPFQLFGQR